MTAAANHLSEGRHWAARVVTASQSPHGFQWVLIEWIEGDLAVAPVSSKLRAIALAQPPLA